MAGHGNDVGRLEDLGLLEDPAAHEPVFIRMTDQLFPDGAAYTAFCGTESRPRAEMRAESLRILREKSEGSWEAVQEVVSPGPPPSPRRR